MAKTQLQIIVRIIIYLVLAALLFFMLKKIFNIFSGA
jgi:hypothetical protein